jgi:hypothetical protein
VDNRLWALLPDDIGGNNELLDYLKGLAASFSVAFTTRGARAPIWESEAVENFKKAWLAIIRGWQLFPPFFPNVLQTQAVQSLCRYSMDRLVESLANLHETPAAIQVADVLTVEQRLTLAVASGNPHVQLACAYQALSHRQRQRPSNLAEAEQRWPTSPLLFYTDQRAIENAILQRQASSNR